MRKANVKVSIKPMDTRGEYVEETWVNLDISEESLRRLEEVPTGKVPTVTIEGNSIVVN